MELLRVAHLEHRSVEWWVLMSAASSAEWSEYMSVASKELQKAARLATSSAGLKVAKTGRRTAALRASMLVVWMAASMVER